MFNNKPKYLQSPDVDEWHGGQAQGPESAGDGVGTPSGAGVPGGIWEARALRPGLRVG